MKLWLRRNWLFTVIVLIPTLASILYYGLLASDVYVSESRFLVRNPQHTQQAGGLFGQLLQGTGISHSQDDTYAVRDYIGSRDALVALQDKLDLRRIYANPHAVFFDRFPGLRWDDSLEEFYRYYGKHVGVEYDPVSSISILTVRAFSAEDAHRINAQLLDMSEHLVNTLNERSREDMIRFARREVQIASDKAKDASVALLSYRSTQSVFAPDKQAALQLEGVAKIQQELISTEAQLAQLKKLSPDNPQIRALVGREDALRSAIAGEAAKVTSARGSFSTHAAEFERLTLDLEFADKQLGVAIAELETARSTAQQKELYLDRLVQPNTPDKAMEPRRLRSILATFLLSFVIWGVASIVFASVREHTD